jgi:phage terminase large subunit GpA-like protein
MLRPPPQLTVSQWADQHRVLSTRASSEPGPWRTSRTPYLRDIMDALSAVHPARRVVFMKGAQVGASEGGNCWLGYIMHHVPAPVLAVQPTVELAKRFSRQRIDPLLEETPALRERVAPARARDSGNTMLSKEFPGGILVLTGANSAVGLRSMTARFLFLDEVDAYPGDVEGEGDPIALAEARARTFGWRRKAYLVSTPTIAGRSRIEREYLASDQRRFFVPCPHCHARRCGCWAPIAMAIATGSGYGRMRRMHRCARTTFPPVGISLWRHRHHCNRRHRRRLLHARAHGSRHDRAGYADGDRR